MAKRDRLEEVDERIQELEEAKEDGSYAGFVPDQLEARQEEREELVQQDEEERQVDRRSPGERREDGDDPTGGAKNIVVREDEDAEPQEFGQETVGTGDSFEEAVAEAELQTGEPVQIQRDIDRVEVTQEQEQRFQEQAEELGQQQEQLQDIDSDAMIPVDQQIAQEIGEAKRQEDLPSQARDQLQEDQQVVQAEQLQDFLGEQKTQAEQAQTDIQNQQEQINQLQEQETIDPRERLQNQTILWGEGSAADQTRTQTPELVREIQGPSFDAEIIGPDTKTRRQPFTQERTQPTQIDKADELSNIIQAREGETDPRNLPPTQTLEGRILGFEEDLEETLQDTPGVTDEMASSFARGSADIRQLFEETIEGTIQLTDPETIQAIREEPERIPEGIQRIRSGQVADTPEEAAILAGTDQQEIARRSGDIFDLAIAGTAIGPGLTARAPTAAGQTGRATRNIDTETSGAGPVLTRSELTDDITPDQLPEGFTQQQREPDLADEIISEQDALIRGLEEDTPVVGQRDFRDTDTITPGEQTPTEGLTDQELEVLAGQRGEDFRVRRLEPEDFDERTFQQAVIETRDGRERVISASGQEGVSLMQQLEDLVDPDAIGLGPGGLVPRTRQVEDSNVINIDESFGPSMTDTTNPRQTDLADVGDVPQTQTPTTRGTPLDEIETSINQEIAGLTTPAAVTSPAETLGTTDTTTTTAGQDTTLTDIEALDTPEIQLFDQELQTLTDTDTATPVTGTTTTTTTTTAFDPETIQPPRQPPTTPATGRGRIRLPPWMLDTETVDEEEIELDIFDEPSPDRQALPSLDALILGVEQDTDQSIEEEFTGLETRGLEQLDQLDQDIDELI